MVTVAWSPIIDYLSAAASGSLSPSYVLSRPLPPLVATSVSPPS